MVLKCQGIRNDLVIKEKFSHFIFKINPTMSEFVLKVGTNFSHFEHTIGQSLLFWESGGLFLIIWPKENVWNKKSSMVTIKNIEIVYISSWRVLYWAKIPAEPNWMKHVKFLWDKKVGWDLPKELKKSQYFRPVPQASTRFWNDNHTPEFQIFCRIWWSNRQTLNFLRVTR